jgi:Family of unknown function (DUF6348)
MKAHILILLIAVHTLSAAPISSLHVKTVLLEKLGAYQNKTDRLYAISDGILRVGDHSVDLTPAVESEGSAQGKSFVAMRIEIAIDGTRRPEFTFGAIGISATQEEAIAVGLGEWYLAFALPFFQAVEGKEPAFAFADYDVFAGALGLRGGAAVGWMDGSEAMNRKILNVVGTVISGKPDFVTLDLKVMVPAGGRPNSECRISGVISADIASRLVALDWPRTAEGYMFKQAFVLKRKKPNQSLQPTAPSRRG